MKPLQYLISNYGGGIVVGLIGDKQQATEEATLAENIFGSYWTDHLFSAVIHMNDVRQFTKYLFLKEYFAIWDEHWTRNRVAKTRNKPDVYSFMRRAAKRARIVLEGQVSYENFMQNITARNNEHTLGSLDHRDSSPA